MKKFLILLTLVFAIVMIAYKSYSIGPFDLFVKDKTTEKDEKKEDKQEEEKAKKKKEINEKPYVVASIGKLLNHPNDFMNKKIKFKGKFNSFTTLALDYKPAFRDSKDFISITIFRPETNIPLAELKMAYPVEDAKDDDVIKGLEKGDLIEIYGEVFSSALDEPWLDIHLIKKLASAKPNEENKEKNKEKNMID